jgi:hypothetical protein
MADRMRLDLDTEDRNYPGREVVTKNQAEGGPGDVGNGLTGATGRGCGDPALLDQIHDCVGTLKRLTDLRFVTCLGFAYRFWLHDVVSVSTDRKSHYFSSHIFNLIGRSRSPAFRLTSTSRGIARTP